ncbi:MAG: hypothetical protein HGB34_00735 [Candidatus Moranbacteria bacterium]|nr:hypothetical protein [Candidatus Moranbacteria bacterium]
MYIILQPNNDSETGQPQPWSPVEVDSNSTQKTLINISLQTLEVLSKKAQELEVKISQDNEKLEKIRKSSINIAKENDRIASLVYVGFIALVVVVAGLVYGYFQYVSADAIKYRYDVAKIEALQAVDKDNSDGMKSDINRINKSIEDLNAIKACLKGRKYWEMESCY